MGFPILVRWHLYIESGPWRIWVNGKWRKHPLGADNITTTKQSTTYTVSIFYLYAITLHTHLTSVCIDFGFQNLYKTDVLHIENHVSDHINCWCMISSPGDKGGNGFSSQEPLSVHPVIDIFNSQSAIICYWPFWIILPDQQLIFKLVKKNNWKNITFPTAWMR